MRRVAIIGAGGAGKSTLARQLGERTGLPVIHLDVHFWRAGWQETPREEWEPKVRALADGERWIIDGNFGGTMEIRLERADTIVFLDFPRYRYLWRAQKRVLQYRNRQRPDLAEGCAERFDGEFSRWPGTSRRRPARRSWLESRSTERDDVLSCFGAQLRLVAF